MFGIVHLPHHRDHWNDGCLPPTPVERMALVSPLRADLLALQTKAGAMRPAERMINGRLLLIDPLAEIG